MVAVGEARSVWWVAARSGFVAAVAGAATFVVAAMLCWLPDAGVSGRPSSAIRAGLVAFLAAQHGGVVVGGIHAGFLPLGMLAAAAIFAWRAGRTIADAATDLDARTVLLALGLAASAYTVACAAMVPLAHVGTSHASSPGALVAAFLVFTLIAGLSLGSASAVSTLVVARIPAILPGAIRGAAAAVCVYIAAGAVLAAGSLALHAHRVMDLSRQVGGGFSGLPILLIDLLCVPNAAVAGTAYLAGPGFAVGQGTTVNAFSTSHGVLPALPLLGAVPDGHGANPVVLALMALVGLLAAVCVARSIRRSRLLGFWRAVNGVLMSGAFTGIVLALVAWLAGGPAGDGRLRTVGASPWQVGVLVAVVVTLLSFLALTVLVTWDHFVPNAPAAQPARELARAAR